MWTLELGPRLEYTLVTLIWVGSVAWLIMQWWAASAAGRILGGRK